MKRAAAAFLLSATSALSLFASDAIAGDKAQCARSYADAQRLRKRGALVDARKELTICLRECGDNVRADCAHWMEEVERAVPSLAVSVRKAGADVQSYTLRIDGAARSEPTRSVELDPGAHEIAIEVAGEQRTQKIVLVEGEKLRRVVFDLPSAEAPTPARPASALTPQPSSPPISADTTSTATHVPWQTIVLGAVGAVGIAGFAGFALYGNARYADLERCKPDCSSDDVAKTKTAYRIGDVSLAVGVVSLGVAAVFWVLDDRKSAPSAARAPGVIRF